MRTPVSVIMEHAEAVHDGVLAPSLKTFEIIRDEAERLDGLIEDLRTLSRADAGELQLEFQPVTLSARVTAKALVMRVQDSGPGIAEAELEHIFDRFYRSDPSRQRNEGGSGLGLAIAKSIVEKHNGRIWAESQPGQGATIVIQLPLAEE